MTTPSPDNQPADTVPIDTQDPTSAQAGSDVMSLVHRRGELLESKTLGQAPGPVDDELSTLRNAIVYALESHPNTIRRLIPGQDDELLLRLATLEPVHPFINPDDLAEVHQRSTGDRACFVLQNPALGDNPLNVVWVALCADLPGGMDDILSIERRLVDPNDSRFAVFYSIWSVEPGLAGIPGGAELLKLVMAWLIENYPGLMVFTTLSPVPGFREWAQGNGLSATSIADEDTLAGACTQYLCTLVSGQPIDPVARFHLRNGAELWRVLPNADHSPLGWDRSWGVMVNYRYDPDELAARSAAMRDGRIALSDQVRALL